MNENAITELKTGMDQINLGLVDIYNISVITGCMRKYRDLMAKKASTLMTYEDETYSKELKADIIDAIRRLKMPKHPYYDAEPTIRYVRNEKFSFDTTFENSEKALIDADECWSVCIPHSAFICTGKTLKEAYIHYLVDIKKIKEEK